MEYSIALRLADEVFTLAGSAPRPEGITANPSRYLSDAAYAATQIPRKFQPEWLLEWAQTWRRLMDGYEDLRAADPMMAYVPANPKARLFHESRAFIRRFRGGNRTSKTQSGYAEIYFCVTGEDPFKPQPKWQRSALIIAGLPFADYVARTFDKKMIIGEDGIEGKNPLSPMFPENGKWFYRYDRKDHIITLRCAECARDREPGMCPGHHKKPTIALCTSEKGVGVIESFSVGRGLIDEHVPKEFLSALKMRVADQSGDICLTGTPLHGPNAWEEEEITKKAGLPPRLNRRNPDDPKSEPYVFMVNVSQWEGNIVTHEQINTSVQGMNVFERSARIDGIPAAITSSPVFSMGALETIKKRCEKDPLRGYLHIVQGKELTGEKGIEFSHDLKFLINPAEVEVDPKEISYRVWEAPVPGAQYIVSVDTAAGLSREANDPSCASVLKLGMRNGALTFSLVAQYHEWTPVHEYSDEVFKLSIWYNSALLVVELTGGLGRAVVERLIKDLAYWNLFRDVRKGEYAEFGQDPRFGIETSPQTKPSMIGVLQQVIKDDRLDCPCSATIGELVAYEQTKTEFGNSRYSGASGSHDDRVMSLVIGVSVAITHAVYDPASALEEADRAMATQKNVFTEWDKERAQLAEEAEWTGYR